MSFALMFRDRKFSSLMWTQFFGAFNDNVLKNALVVLLAFKGVEMGGLHSESLVTLATLIFILPYFLFSALAGQLADKFNKDLLIRIVKTVEIIIMFFAGIGFYYHLYGLLFLSLFLMGLHSTFFGPIKYSALPDLVSHDQLTAANASVEVGTFIAILLGTIGGGYLISLPNGELFVIGLLFLNSLIGYFFGKKVPPIKAADSTLQLELNPIPPTISSLKFARQNHSVFNSILGISWFWLLGAIILSLLPSITKMVLNGNENIVTLFLAVFTIGIASGAFICEKLSHEEIEIGLVPLGSLGMTFFLTDLAWVISQWVTVTEKIDMAIFIQQSGAIRLLFDLFGTAIFGGIFTVPLYTLLQDRSPPECRSRIIGANNIMNACFMVVGSGLLMILLQNKISFFQIILLTAAMNLIVAIYIYHLVPEFTLRFISWINTHCFYRLRAQGKKKKP